jgi:two-component system, cell cycle sensor histidine kinase and response regulator CckA
MGLFTSIRLLIWPTPGQALSSPLRITILALYALVVLFDIVVAYQHFQIKKIRRHFAEREDLFRLIGEHAADMIAVIDAKGNRLYNSPAYERILGYNPEELKKTPAFDQIHPDDRERVQKVAAQTVKTGRGQQVEYRMKHKSGAWVELESTANAVLGADGKVDKLVIVNRNVTERNRLQNQVQQAQKMSSLGRMSGGIAHDFNNVLGVIIGYGEHLKAIIGDGSPARSSVDELLKAGKRGALLTNQLVAFSRLQVFNPELIILNEIVSRLRYMLERVMGTNIKIVMNLNPDLGTIYADQGQMEQIILNLAMNSHDAMTISGELVISTDNVQIDQAFARNFSGPVVPGPYVVLTVKDSGEGMTPEVRSRIFEPFFTTKKANNAVGLGLSMVEGVVKQSGGHVEVLSEAGSGTEFQIYLPRTSDKVAQKDAPSESRGAEEQGHDKTILLVHGEAALRNLAVSTLERSGYKVLVAHGGAEGLEMSRKFSGKIDLLLTDLVMEGMSGREIAKKLVLDRPSIQVMYMSGFAEKNVEKLPVLPGSLFIQKPFTRETLAEKIHEALCNPKELQRV